MSKKSKVVAEFGDFQTPDALADNVVNLIKSLGFTPRTVLEPTCGRGAFLVAASKAFHGAELFGLDINDGSPNCRSFVHPCSCSEIPHG
jgi:hypothetical protein